MSASIILSALLLQSAANVQSNSSMIAATQFVPVIEDGIRTKVVTTSAWQDGKLVASMRGRAQYWSKARECFVVTQGKNLYDWRPGESLKQITTLDKSPVSVAEAADGKRIAVSYENSIVFFNPSRPDAREGEIKLREHQVLRQIANLNSGAYLWGMAFSPNGRQLAVTLAARGSYVGGDGNHPAATVYILDLDKKAAKKLCQGGVAAWMENGNLLIKQEVSGEALAGAVCDPSGKILAKTGPILDIGWNGSQVQALTTSGTLKSYDNLLNPMGSIPFKGRLGTIMGQNGGLAIGKAAGVVAERALLQL